MKGFFLNNFLRPIGGRGGFSWSSYWATLISATVETAAPTDVVLTFPTAQTSLGATDFTIAGFTIVSASWTGAVLTLVLSSAVLVFDGNLTITFTTTGTTATVTNNVADDGNTVAWYDYSDTSTITQVGGVVSQWADKLGSGHDLIQATEICKPILNANGVRFTRTANENVADGNFMKTANFAFIQPEAIYIVFRQISWNSQARIWDGNDYNKMCARQLSEANKINIVTNGVMQHNDSMNIGAFGIVRALYNGALSEIQINNHLKQIGSAGTTDAGGFTIGGAGDGLSYTNSDIEVKAIILRTVADDDATKGLIYRGLKNSHLTLGAIDEGWGVNKEPMVAFVLDDGTPEMYTAAYPLFQSYGMKFNAAIRTDYLGVQITAEQLLTMQTAGHEIMSHSATHADLTAITVGEAITELQSSMDALTTAGLNVYNFVYPFGAYNAAVAAEVMNIYESAVVASGGGFSLPVALSHIYRFDLDLGSAATAEAYIDLVIENEGNLNVIFMTHPYTWNAAQVTKMNQVLTYIQGKGLVPKRMKQVIDTIKSYDGIPTYNY